MINISLIPTGKKSYISQALKIFNHTSIEKLSLKEISQTSKGWIV